MSKNAGNIFVGILMAIVAIFAVGWQAERSLLNRKILRNRAKRSDWTSRW